MTSSSRKVCRFTVYMKTQRKGSRSGFFHPETLSAFTGSVWTISQNDAKFAFTLKSVSVWTGRERLAACVYCPTLLLQGINVQILIPESSI